MRVGREIGACCDSATHCIRRDGDCGPRFRCARRGAGRPGSGHAGEGALRQAGLPSDQPLQAIGSYAKGCLAGAQPLPLDGPHWQVMRLSRNRHWGTPRLIDYIEKLANDAAKLDGWPGLLSATCRSRAAAR